MAVRFECSCGKKLKASDEKIGKKVLCSGCGKTIRVPDADSVAKKEPAAAPAISKSSTSAAHIASDLLRRTDSDAKARSSVEEEAKPRSEVDYAASVRSFALTVVPGIAVVTVIVVLAYALSSMVIGGGPPRPELALVSGTVTLDGQPLAGATVNFRPLPPQGEMSAKGMGASFGRTDESGKYELSYVKDVPGAVLGPHRVQIHARAPNGRPLLPPIYNRLSTLTVEVKSGSNENVDFALVSAAQVPPQP
jgi:hypothetical protein